VLLKELRIEGGKPRPVHGQRETVSEAETVQAEDGPSGLHRQPFRHLGRAWLRGPVKNGRAGHEACAPHILREVCEPDEAVGDPPIAHEGAEPLPPVNESIGLKRLEGTTYSHPAHPETLGEVVLGGELRVGQKASHLDLPPEP
jgi:hypothetical protein